LLAERNAKRFKFNDVDEDTAKLLLGSDVHSIREKLMDGTITSVGLVNFFGKRSYVIGRDLCLSTEELFDDAFKLAAKYDEERNKAL